MKTGYKDYHVDVKNVKFIADDGRTCPRTAIITFYDRAGKVVDTELFGAIETKSVYELVKEGKDIVLDNFYVSDFSLSDFRRHNDIEKKSVVPIKGFSAKNAFFDYDEARNYVKEQPKINFLLKRPGQTGPAI